jgi:hypothetical protein
LRHPRFHWSFDVRVSAPAQRDDAAAVRARLRPARRSSPRPSRQRTARSWRASRPKCSPTAHSTCSSAVLGRMRARIRAPAGAAATNGAARERMFPGILADRDSFGRASLMNAGNYRRNGQELLTPPGCEVPRRRAGALPPARRYGPPGPAATALPVEIANRKSGLERGVPRESRPTGCGRGKAPSPLEGTPP